MINLNKETLTGAIKAFGKECKIFQSEAQFQFELAWKLQKQFPDCRVKLEDMRAAYVKKEEKNGIKRKFYTDIVLEEKGYSIAIELKYKTAEYYDEKSGICLFEHGAVDLGRYDYLWDVHRVELLTGKGNNKEFSGDVEVLNNKGCNKGFAVLLTNEEKYWTQSYIDKKDTMDNQFKIGNKTHVLYNKDLDWKKIKEDNEKYNKNYRNYPTTILKKNGTPSERAQPIHLVKQYDYRWVDYCNFKENNNGLFRFVIIEV